MRRRPASTETVVLNLFGQAASTPQYAIHEEDRLEWLHALLSDTASLPDWLNYPLKHQPMLFIGCEIPDWVGRFLLRMSSNSRLSLSKSSSSSPGAQHYMNRRCRISLTTYCRKTQVQQLRWSPTEFVAELRARWEKNPREAAHCGSAIRLLAADRRQSLSATCARMRTLRGGCVTRSRLSVETCGWTKDGYSRAMPGKRRF